MLKKLWQSAICNELDKFDDDDKAAKIPVIVVPVKKMSFIFKIKPNSKILSQIIETEFSTK